MERYLKRVCVSVCVYGGMGGRGGGSQQVNPPTGSRAADEGWLVMVADDSGPYLAEQRVEDGA